MVHDWMKYKDLTVCAKCGVVKNKKNADAENCRGHVKVVMREDPPGRPGDSWHYCEICGHPVVGMELCKHTVN